MPIMIETAFNPGWLPIAVAFLIPILSRPARGLVLLVTPLIVLALVWLTVTAPSGSGFLKLTPHASVAHAFGHFFAIVFAIALFAGNLFALKQANTLELSAASFYAGSAIYAVLCNDLLSFVIFWELMMLGSAGIIFAAGTSTARQAGIRYLLVHGLSGVLLLIGVLGVIGHTDDAALRTLSLEHWYHWLILFGLLINAGAPPLSAWVSDAYPEASP